MQIEIVKFCIKLANPYHTNVNLPLAFIGYKFKLFCAKTEKLVKGLIEI